LDAPVDYCAKQAPGHTTILDVELTRNQPQYYNLDLGIFRYSLSDSVVTSSKNEGEFYQLSYHPSAQAIQSLTTSTNIDIMLGETSTLFEAKIYTFWEMLAGLGGIYVIIFLGAKIITVLFVEKIAKFELINTLNKHFGADEIIKKVEKINRLRNLHIYKSKNQNRA
jgi:hypothetical protein